MESLLKKDDNLEVVESNMFGTIIKTDLDIGEEIVEETFEPFFISVPVQVTRHVFTINLFLLVFLGILGIIPYYVLQIYGNFIINITLLCCSITSLLIFYFIMMFFHRIEWFLLFSILLHFSTVMISVMLKSMVIYQGCSILFLQHISILIYSLFDNKKAPKFWRVVLIMMFSGIFGWLVSFYGFYKEQNWISAAILFLFCVLSVPFYSAYEVKNIKGRYSLSEKDLVKATIEYFTDFPGMLILILRKQNESTQVGQIP